MKNRLLSACLLAAAATGCDEATTPSKMAAHTPHPVIARAAMPAAILQPEPVEGPSTSLGVKGTEPEESLAMDHPEDRTNHLQRARDLKVSGDFSDALVEARRALHDAPDDEQALELCARLAREVGQPAIAFQAYDRLSELRPDDGTPLVAAARMLLLMGAPDRAAAVGQKAIARDAENPEAFHVTGRAYLNANDLPPAIAMFNRAVELRPDHGYALNNLGLAYLRTNQNQAATEVLSMAADLLPNVAYVHNNLGVALERTGRTEEAAAEYGLSTSLSPKYVKAAINSKRLKKTAGVDLNLLEEILETASDARLVEPPTE